MPSWGEERISNMIATRPDWCISRQRVWGVPIIVFYCEAVPRAAHRPQDPRPHRRAVRRAHRRHLVRAQRRPSCIAPATTCPKCGGAEFTQGERHSGRLVRLRLEPSRRAQRPITACPGPPTCTWKAATSIAAGSTARCWWAPGSKGGAPYRACALNGWVLDGEGKAMHKSLGNAIEPEEVIKQHGAEILRLWSASVDFNEDVRMSETILTRLTEAYRKLRNTFRYMLGNLSDFDPRTDAVPGDELTELDQWILLRAEDLVARCRVWYDEFEFHKVYHAVYAFATVDLSAVYFDVLKDRLYTSAAQIASAPQRADRALPAARRAGAAARADHELHRGRGLDAHGAARTASIWRYFPEPARADRRASTTPRGNGPPTGTVSWK